MGGIQEAVYVEVGEEGIVFLICKHNVLYHVSNLKSFEINMIITK